MDIKDNRCTKQFFYDHAGWCYDPKTETPEQGRNRCAQTLADAHRSALSAGYTFEWDIDPDTDSSEFLDGPVYELYICVLVSPEGDSAGSIGGVDFGPTGDASEDYGRVVEAELAADHMTVIREDSQDAHYIRQQLDQLTGEPKIKIRGTNGTETNWINITSRRLRLILDMLDVG